MRVETQNTNSKRSVLFSNLDKFCAKLRQGKDDIQISSVLLLRARESGGHAPEASPLHPEGAGEPAGHTHHHTHSAHHASQGEAVLFLL